MIMSISGAGPELRRQLSARRSLLLPRLDRAPDNHQALVGPGHRPFDQKQVSLGVDPQHLEVLDRNAITAHPSRHPHSLEYPPRRGARPNRAGRPQPVRLTVSFRAAPEAVTLDHALETPPLRRAGDVDQLALGECVG